MHYSLAHRLTSRPMLTGKGHSTQVAQAKAMARTLASKLKVILIEKKSDKKVAFCQKWLYKSYITTYSVLLNYPVPATSPDV